MKKKLVTLLCLVCLFGATGFVACEQSEGTPSQNTASTESDGLRSESTYSVTYDGNGGLFADGSSSFVQSDLELGVALTAPSSPQRANYTFAGWSKDKFGNSMWQFATDRLSGDTTLYAVWVQQSATILSLDGASMNGTDIFMLVDENIDSVSLANKVVCTANSYWRLYYDRLGQMEIPTKIAAGVSGYLANGDNIFYLVVTSSDQTQVNVYELTVYRKYPVYVTYYNDNAPLKNETVYTGNEFSTSYTPNIPGYTFEGWKTADGEAFVSQTLWGALSLYADKKANTYKVTYDANGGNALEIQQTEVTYDEAFRLPKPTRAGYTFDGWYDGSTKLTNGQGESLDKWNYAQDKRLRASWIPNEYRVTLNKSNDNAGYVSGAGSYEYDSRVTVYASTYSGYTWAGWYDQDGKLVSESTSYTFTMGFDTCYTAKWVAYTLTTAQNNSSAGSITQYTNQKITQNQSVTITASTNNGYTFVGWYDGQELLSTALSYTFAMPGRDVTYTAKWCKVAVAANAPAAGSVTELTGKYAVGDSATVTATTNEGYTWVGWYNGQELLSTALSYTFAMPAEDTTYTAKWCKVTVEANAPAAGSVTELTGKYAVGDSVTVTATTNEGYTFVGWYNGGELLSLEFSYTFAMPAENVTYTAKWLPTTVTLSTSHSEIENAVSGLNTTNNVIGNSVRIEAQSMLGWDFLGWYANNLLLTEEYAYTITVTENAAEYVAKYQIKEEMASFLFRSTDTTCEIIGLKDQTLTEIVIPNYVTAIGGTDGYLSSENLQRVYFESGSRLTTINGGGFFFGCFSGCSNLTTIEIPESVTEIGDWAFMGCSKLTGVVLPEGLKILGSGAFTGCESLIEEENGIRYVDKWVIRCDVETVTVATLRSDTRGIATSAFTDPNWLADPDEKVNNLTSVNLPNSLRVIGDYAFQGATKLTEITIPEGVLYIGEYAFNRCSSLVNISIPESVKEIGYYAFDGCSKLIQIENGVHYVDNWVVDIDRGITTVLFKENVRGIAPYGLSSFKGVSIVIPDSIQGIGKGSFYYCENLTSVTFENAQGWYIDGVEIPAEDLSDTERAAKYVTDTFINSVWIRIDEA